MKKVQLKDLVKYRKPKKIIITIGLCLSPLETIKYKFSKRFRNKVKEVVKEK